MNESLYTTVLERLLEETALPLDATELVGAACDGEAALDRQLETLGGSGSAVERSSTAPRSGSPPSAYLEQIEVTGFRGVGPTTKLPLSPGPGLTIVLGRNGTGKSSFAEGLEVLLTGTSRRWEGRPQVWKEGWRCLHATGATRVGASFAVEGRSTPLRFTRSWSSSATLEASTTSGDADLGSLDWSEALATFRPFLSSRDLDAALEKGTSKLFDEMKSILGLADLTTARNRLANRRKALEKKKKSSRAELDLVLTALNALDDPRADACRAALSSRKQDLDAAEALVTGGAVESSSDLADLRALSTLNGHGLEALIEAAEQLREASRAVEGVTGTQAARAAELARLIEQALAWQQDEDDDCPVCGQVLPAAWREHARGAADEARRGAEDARAATDALASATRAAKRMLQPVPRVLTRAESHGLGGEAAEAWRAWSDFEGAGLELADHLETRGVALADALGTLRDAAKEKLAALTDRWKPVAVDVARWLAGARDVQEAAPRLTALKKAEAWMKNLEEELRTERFAPISGKAQEIWAKLRQQSDVDLTDVRLAGTANRRKVELDVTVAGRSGVALGVMSQGELNALALSLFLPRMLLDESPFRFVVVDDPVQSMDPTKVEGLAEVFGDAAKTRQVVVFTHDPRLAEATRRLGIEASVLRVARKDGSVVEIAPWLDPVRRHLSDARRVAREDQVVGRRVAERIVPGLCRMAVEAAASSAFRRSRLAGGGSHEDVEMALADAKGLVATVTLGLFGDPNRHGQTYSTLNNKFGSTTVDLIKALNTGSHQGWTQGLDAMIRQTETLVRGLR